MLLRGFLSGGSHEGGVQRTCVYTFTALTNIKIMVLGCISLNLGRKWMVLRYWVTEESLIKVQVTDICANRLETTKDATVPRASKVREHLHPQA